MLGLENVDFFGASGLVGQVEVVLEERSVVSPEAVGFVEVSGVGGGVFCL